VDDDDLGREWTNGCLVDELANDRKVSPATIRNTPLELRLFRELDALA
jgi:hypothetical protein